MWPRSRRGVPTRGPLPLSATRRRYGIQAAAGVVRTLNSSVDADASTVQFNLIDGSAGIKLSPPTITNNSDGSVLVGLNGFANWFLRFLGMYVQFLNPSGQIIPLSQLNRSQIFPDNNVPIESLDLDSDNAYFAGLLPPPFSVAGIPVAPGSYSINVTFPSAASTFKIYLGGLGYNGSVVGPQDARILGLGMTVAVNYGLVAFFMGIGASGIDPIVKLFGGLLGQMIAQDILAGISAELNGASLDIFKIGIAFIKALLNGLAGKGLTQIVAVIFAYVAEATAEEMIPVVGIIARVAAAVIGAVQLAETTIEAGLSPPVYEFDLVRSHNLTLTILPSAGGFPILPSGYTLYYKVNYLFDSASPHYLPAVTLAEPYPPSIMVPLSNLPQGGTINTVLAFTRRRTGSPSASVTGVWLREPQARRRTFPMLLGL